MAAAAASASLTAFRMAAEGFSPLIRRVFIFLLGAVEGMTRQSQMEKMMPREMVAAVSHLGTPTLVCRQDTQSDQLLQSNSYSARRASGRLRAAGKYYRLPAL